MSPSFVTDEKLRLREANKLAQTPKLRSSWNWDLNPNGTILDICPCQ